jgi:hypothetical protein
MSAAFACALLAELRRRLPDGLQDALAAERMIQAR